MISGVVIPEGAEFVYPPNWRREIDARAPFPVNGLGWQPCEQQPETLIRLLEQVRPMMELTPASEDVEPAQAQT